MLYFLWVLTPYVVLVGLGMGVGGAMFPPIMADLFPGPNLGRIMGISSVFSGMGADLGSWLAGYLYDITGSYAWGFLCVLMLSLGLSYSSGSLLRAGQRSCFDASRFEPRCV